MPPQGRSSVPAVWPGSSYPLGATYDGAGTNFSVFAECAERVELCLIAKDGTEERVNLDEVDGWRLPAGSIVLALPWALHRDARYWPDPLKFRPERWLDVVRPAEGCTGQAAKGVARSSLPRTQGPCSSAERTPKRLTPSAMSPCCPEPSRAP